MLKVIIIDDEALVRVGLKSMIDWEKENYEIIGEAANGQEGLDLIIKHHPDIVITDIKMPVLDGLEMMRQVLKGGVQPKFIILSSFDEFNLVKQAMKQGAEEYLIKLDLEPELLTKTLSEVREKISAEHGAQGSEGENTGPSGRLEQGMRENISMLREGFFKRLISRPTQDPEEIREQITYLGIELNENSLACLLARITNIAALDKYASGELRLFEASVLNTIQEIVNDVFKGYTFTWNPGEFMAIFSNNANTATLDSFDFYREKAAHMAERILEMLKQYFNISVVVGFSNPFHGFGELNRAYFESCRAVQQSFYSGARPVLFFAEVPENIQSYEKIDISDFISNLPKAIELFDSEQIRTVLGRVSDILTERKISKEQAYDVCFQIAYLLCGTTGFSEAVMKEIAGYPNSLHESILELHTLPQIIDWISNLEQGLCDYLAKNEEQKNHRLIARVKKYIMEHYREEISLQDAADAAGISPGYLSTIFKQYSGICFTDFITETKISEAKKLLRESDYKIYEIS
ncbi:MAG TPA: response regulator, partial [Bacillota bacterium]|nr:response regulator [Bacillota bacterium]